MIFFRNQWPGGPQEVGGQLLRPRREGSVFVLDAPAKHKQALVALGWKVRGSAPKAPEPASEPAPPPTPAPAPVEPSSAAIDMLSSNAKTVCKNVRAGDCDEHLSEMLDLEEQEGVGAGSSRRTVVEAIKKRMAEID